MTKCYLGIDIGSISTKAVIVDENNQIILSEYV
jgi:activator of 2-hydroxyglutaryl-CoA dehydratase